MDEDLAIIEKKYQKGRNKKIFLLNIKKNFIF